MVVNVLFFAVSSVLVVEMKREVSASAATGAAAATFGALVLFGETVPKSIAYANSQTVSTFSTLPTVLIVNFLKPFLYVFNLLVTEPVIRLIQGGPAAPQPVTASEFRSLVEHVGRSGEITAAENKLLTQVIQLGYLKVRDCLRPRVDMVACSVSSSPKEAKSLMQAQGITKIPVYEGDKDNIVGLVYLRDILLAEGKGLRELVQEVNFVPEQKTVESLLEYFRWTGTDTAIVVDEYGGISGQISVEDVAGELLGPVEVVSEVEPIEQVGPLTYRLSGDLAIHEWAEAFGLDISKTGVSTLAGLVTAGLGKIPREGDTFEWGNLKFQVERVRRHRIETIILTFEPIGRDRNAE
jgi:CBS domain containing-hemolysin-like protein